jgi:serine/threonine protein kinase
VDLFAASIILFIMVSQHPPFTTAQPQDPFYRCLAANRADIFWTTHCKSKDNGDAFFSEDFKDLIQAMLQLDSIHRPSISEVIAHKWMQGPVPSTQEVIDEFEKRHLEVKASIEDQKQEKLAEKAKRVEIRRKEVMRATEDETEEVKFDGSTTGFLKPMKNMDDYEKVFSTSTEFFSTYNPDMIEDALLEHLRKNMKIEPKVHNSKYKVQFTLSTNS